MSFELPGYRVTDTLYQSEKDIVYLAVRELDQTLVAIKTLRSDYPSHQDIARFQHEYAIHQLLSSIKGVVGILSQENSGNSLALVMEYVEGGTLDTLNRDDEDFLNLFFNIATQISQAVAEIHQHFIIHKDISLSNILWEPKTQTIKIIDFGLATELSREKQNQNTDLLTGSLPYISPEQTGRMNRSIDYRSDFYSLGVTFYKLLTGEYPFDVEDNDPMTWVHCHIAKQPKPLKYLDSAVSPALSAIINKLLAKNAEDRYQSGLGIKNDLEHCWSQWRKTGGIDNFTPGLQDISDRFEIPQKLYGRENEVSRLLNAFADINISGSKLFLVSGYSGIGKSALINEIHKPIVAQKGFFIVGKFDQFQRNIPYSAIAQAFKGLMKQLLAQPPEHLEIWKMEFQKAVADNGQVLIDIIPELEKIIGAQPPVPHLGTEENQNRFNRLVLKFLQVCTQKNHPLVLFLDDLQWVDSASLGLIKLFILNKSQNNFLLLGAYRDNEVDQHHPFMVTVSEIEKADVPVPNLDLKPLQLEDINQLLVDMLQTTEDKTKPLAQLVLDKTAGNPFFINQFLKNIYQSELLSFDTVWQWDLDKIEKLQSSTNVVDLLLTEMQRLPELCQEELRLAACIGNIFDLQVLAIISEKSLPQIAKDLWPAVKAGLLVVDGDSHALLRNIDNDAVQLSDDFSTVMEQFVHDRVQQAAYLLIDEAQKQKIHLKIGRLLLKNTLEEKLDNLYFEIVEHYNKSIALVTDHDELIKLAQLNLIVAQKAKASTAYLPALQYFHHAAQCLQNFAEQEYSQLYFAIEKGTIECNFLLANIEAGVKQADALLSKCKSIEDKVDVNNILILYYGGAGEMDRAIDIALDSLRYLGVDIPRDPSQVQLLTELARAKISLGRKKTDELISMPEFEDKDLHTVFSLLKELVAPTYLQGLSTLLPYIILRMFNLTLKHGNSSVSSFVYSGYALLWAKLGDFSEAYRFGVLAMQANERVDNPPMEARCYFMCTSFALYWGQPLKIIHEPRKTGLQKLLDTGEYFWASYINLFGFWQEAVLSQSLDDLFELTSREINFAKKAKQIEPYYVHILHKNLFKNLAGETLEADGLDVIEGDEAEALAYFAGNHTSTMGLFYHVVCRLVLHYYREEYQQAVTIATQDKITDEVIKDGTYTRVIYTFFTCLSLLALKGSRENEVEKSQIKHYKKGRKDLKKWYALFAENFSCPWFLLLAEEARIDNQHQTAIEYYEQALLAAKKSESALFESLSCELYAKFWLSKGNKKIAATYMVEAGYLYYRWGAKGKLKLLENNYGMLFSEGQGIAQSLQISDGFDEKIGDSFSSVTDGGSETLDLKTLVKASQALSSELVMDKLVQKLMHFLIENAGAQKGILILAEAGQLVIEAECSLEQEHEVLSQQSSSLDDATNVSVAIVRYVVRSKETVVLSAATQSEQFGSDSYLNDAAIKSVLCIPLIDKGEVIGALYLENNITTDSFTPKRVEVLKVLSAEISIALENARLYRRLEENNLTLEEKVKERTEVLRAVNETLLNKNEEIQQSKKTIEKNNYNITKSIQYAKKIQDAILPLNKTIAEVLVDFFIIFKPKQIVSGDFYWLNKIQDKIFVVVADCTGHGVPGAFLSMIGHSLLNKIIKENKIYSPALILEKLHIEMRAALRQEGMKNQTYDGMDIGICQIDLGQKKVVYAAAKRPLYFYSLSENGNEPSLNKILGDRKSIGGVQKEQQRFFAENEFFYSSGDMLYLSSDGLVDQHNEYDKKFGSLQLQVLLKTVADKKAETQKTIILDALSQHQGNELQRDDMTLFGLRLE